MKISVILTAFLAVSACDCARILGVFPSPSISHQVVFHSLMRDLAARGHQLTILTTDVIKSLEKNANVTQIDLHGSYEIFRQQFSFVETKMSRSEEADLMEKATKSHLKILEYQLNQPAVKKLIRKENGEKFDLLIIERFLSAPMVAFAELFDCPAIDISPLDNFAHWHEEMGNEVNPAIHSEVMISFEHGKLSFAERWTSLKYYLKHNFLMTPTYNRAFDDVIRRHFPTVTKPVTELHSRIQLMMTNTNPAFGWLRPLLPNTIQLGFMHIEPPKPLPAGDLKTFLDNSKHGVIYMSFGSNVQSKELGLEVQQMFLKVFKSLRYDVVWKFETDDLPNKPDNVMISKWLPQADLLAHPAVKLFITQGGQQSAEEAVDRTVPVIVVPFMADQGSNARRLESKGVGKRLELLGLTESVFADAIQEMLKPEYKENMKKLRELVYDQPMTSRERAVWWTEYVIRHKGAKHFDYPGRHVPFYQKYWLDFIGIALLTLLLTIKVSLIVFRKLFSRAKAKKE